MNWKMNPFESFGPIFFGQTRAQVRAMFDGSVNVFRKIQGENATDAFDSVGLHIYYDDCGRAEFVEAFYPASPTFQEIVLIGRQADDVISDLSALGYDGICDDVGYHYDKLGFGLTVSNGIVEGVAMFRAGYYD